MPIAFVQSKSNSNGSNPAASMAATFNSNVGAGQRLLIVSVYWFHTGGVAALADISTVTDTLGTVFTNAIFGTNQSDTRWGIATHYGLAPVAGGADTVTTAWNASYDYSRIAITEVSGNDTSIPFDVAANNSDVAPDTAPNSGNVTTAFAGEFIYGFVQTGSVGSITAGVNEAFTKREDFDGAVARSATEDVIQVSAGVTSVQFALGAATGWQCQIATFKPAIIIPTLIGSAVPPLAWATRIRP